MTQSLEMGTIDMFRDAMGGATKRHEAFSNNLANANTPGYKRRDVSFKDQLKEKYIPDEFDRSSPFRDWEFDSDWDEVQPEVIEVDDTSMRNDKNNIDPDKEAAELSKNTLYYNGLATMTRKQFNNLTQLLGTLER